MSTPDKDRVNRLVLELLAEDPDDAAVALFTRLCRQSPKLRAWLWDEFARSSKTRAEFARILAEPGRADHLTLAHAAGEDRPRDAENARLRSEWQPGLATRPYGGLSRPEVEGWIRRYQSGSLHPATFQLVLAWRRTAGTQPASPALMRASAAFLAYALGRDHRGLLRQLIRVERFFRDRQQLGRAAYGHLHRWNPAATNRNQWYVAISRGRKRALVFTSNKAELRADVQRLGDRRLALDLKVSAPGLPPTLRPLAPRLPGWTRRAWAIIQCGHRLRAIERYRARLSPVAFAPQHHLGEPYRAQVRPGSGPKISL